MNESRRISPLVTWRLIAVLCIIIYHCGVEECGPGGWFAVSFCFMMSGFLMMWQHPDGIDGTYRHYLWRRAKRFYPLHWAITAVTLLLFMARPALGAVPRPWVIALNASLLQSFVPISDVYYSINTFSWFLSALLFCYAVFPLLRRLLAKMRLRWQLLLVIVMAATVITFDATLTKQWREFLCVFPPMRMLDFLLGMVVYRFYTTLNALDRQNAKHKPAGVVKATLLELTVIIFVLEVCVIDWGAEILRPYEDVVLWWIPSASVILMCARLSGQEGLIGRLLSWRPLQRLGRATLEIYLLQGVVPMLVAITLLPLAAHFGLHIDNGLIPLCVAAIVVTAVAVNTVTRRLSRGK